MDFGHLSGDSGCRYIQFLAAVIIRWNEPTRLMLEVYRNFPLYDHLHHVFSKITGQLPDKVSISPAAASRTPPEWGKSLLK